MRVVEIEVPGELPGMNEIIAESKRHYSKYSSMKAKYTEVVAWCSKGKGPFERIDLDITYYCKNRKRDPDNIIGGGNKFVLDGLVTAGVIENDGWKQIRDITARCKLDKNNPRIAIKISEL